MNITRCPACHGTARNPEAPAAIGDDDGTCLVCCFPSAPQYAAHHGYVRPNPDDGPNSAAGARKAEDL